MDNIDVAKIKSSFYCWIVLTVFIVLTLVFMVNFYNKAVDEIINNASFNGHLRAQELEIYD